MEAIVFGLAAGITALIAIVFLQRKPETPAQRKRRLYREAAAEEKRMWNLTRQTSRRLNPKSKFPKKYRPSKRQIERRMREMARN